MAISIPPYLPARWTLEAEGLQIVSSSRQGFSRCKPVRIAVLNLMPNKPATEVQIARLLAAAPYPVELTLFVPKGYVPKTTPWQHLWAHYTPWQQVQSQRFDGLIVTGAPVEHLPFEAVSYWDQLTEILDWAQSESLKSLHICWAAQAALYHWHGVPKRALKHKMFGLYEQSVCKPGDALLRGFNKTFRTPVSRHTEIREIDLPVDAGLDILARSEDSGLCLIDDKCNAATYMFNHLEYDAGTLKEEYERDVRAGKPIQPPRHYFVDEVNKTAPENIWREHAQLLFRNWLREIGVREQGEHWQPSRSSRKSNILMKINHL